MTFETDLVLSGSLVRLEPLSHDHLDGLIDAATDGELWNLFYTSVPRPEGMAAEIDRRLSLRDQGEMLPFTAIRQENEQVLGMTTFCNPAFAVPRVEIGYTWNRASAHGAGTNPESKLLLMGYAFEALEVASVVYCTNWMNQQSRAAIERLGARQDGILRNDTRDRLGNLRDTVRYSVLPHEWPAVRTALELRVKRHLDAS